MVTGMGTVIAVAGLRLDFIGTGNAFAPDGLCWNGFVVDGRFLFETPPSALMSLNRTAIDPNAIDAVFISHHHGDHFLGLPSLLLHWKYRGRTRPVTIVGPRGTEGLARVIGQAVYPSIFETPVDIHWVVGQPGRCITIGDLTVEPVEVRHDDKLSSNLGYQCELHGVRFGYTGDTAMCEAVLDLARASDVLISECASRADEIPIHLNLVKDIPQVRAAMPSESTLLLTHIASDVDDAGIPGVLVAEDHKRYEF